MKINRGEIYWIKKNPHKESYGSCQNADRPGIIVSNNLNNAHSYTFEIVYLTTTPKKDLPTHVAIEGANRPSIALCEQIHTISDEQIGSYIGQVSPEEINAINEALLISLGIEEITPNEEKPEPQNDHHMSPSEIDMNNMHIQLIAAQKEAEIYQKLYTDILQKTLDK